MRRVRLALVLALCAVSGLAVSPAAARARPPYLALRSPLARPISDGATPVAATRPQADWLSAGTMDTAVAETGGGAFLDGRVFVPGGFRSDFESVFDRMQVYSAATNTWTTDSERMPMTLVSMARGWADAAVCAGAGRVFVVNGLDGEFIYTALQIFNPSAPPGARWTLGPYPATSTTNVFFSQASGCAVIGTGLYLFGGLAAIGDPNDPRLIARPSRVTWVLDLRSGIWTDTGHRMDTARFWHGYAGGTQSLVVAGGTNDVLNFTPTPTAERFSPSTGWMPLPNLPRGRLGLGMGVIDVGGPRAAVFGGLDPLLLPVESTLTCDLTACAGWVDANRDLIVARGFMAWGASSSNLYAAGGQNTLGAVLASAEKAAP